MAGKPENDSDMTMTRGSRPVPDPTVLTTQALAQAIAALKELFEVRVSAIEKQIAMIQTDLEQRSKETREQVKHLELLHNEKFCRISTQIGERDVQTDKASRDVKSAVDAAFAAAKEAVGEQNKSNAMAIAKSETSTLKQLDGITDSIRTNTQTMDGKINDIKDRITVIESHGKGTADSWGYLVGLIGMVVGIVIAVGAILTALRH